MAHIVITIDTCENDHTVDFPATVETREMVAVRTAAGVASTDAATPVERQFLEDVSAFDSGAALTVSPSRPTISSPPVHERARGDLGRHIDSICQAAGLNVMVEVLEIVLDRELLEPAVVYSLGAADIQVLYDRYIEPAFDRVESRLSAGASVHEGCRSRYVE